MDMMFTPNPVNSTSINIKWDNNYPDCSFQFDVFVDGEVVQEKLVQSSYTLTDLNQTTTYNVCVTARDAHRTRWMHCADATTAAITSGFTGECVYYQASCIKFAVASRMVLLVPHFLICISPTSVAV